MPHQHGTPHPHHGNQQSQRQQANAHTGRGTHRGHSGQRHVQQHTRENQQHDSRQQQASGQQHWQQRQQRQPRGHSQQHQQQGQQTGHAEGFGSEPQGNDQRRSIPQRGPGERRQTEIRSTKSTSNPREGSQRGEDSVQGVSGRAGGQYGDLHGHHRTQTQQAGFHAEDRYAGEGMSTQQHRFGSRQGHGTRRRDPHHGQ
ncbi:hypothetical protein ACFR9U_13230 [Halorientalis brevis]|uniref:Uncharacterized protein n=1 Tax=Halorientalis brevis TaxID=1126241 RepID=A0ABD6CF20_9EURY|nr:hypothetical protein [Halorientalis brevis]